jgi:hypothetical protein
MIDFTELPADGVKFANCSGEAAWVFIGRQLDRMGVVTWSQRVRILPS